jgi:hypothetical protein
MQWDADGEGKEACHFALGRNDSTKTQDKGQNVAKLPHQHSHTHDRWL